MALKKDDLAILVPTRGRPHNVTALCHALEKTQTEGHLYLAMDDDDPTLEECTRIAHLHGHEVLKGPRQTMVKWTNDLALMLHEAYPYLASIGDDHHPRTERWDWLLMCAIHDMPKHLGFAYPDDGWQGRNLATAVVMSSAVVGQLGYMMPPAFQHYYVDNVWMQWAVGMGRLHYAADVVVEHVHPDAGKAPTDDLYRLTSPLMDLDHRTFNEYCQGQAQRDVDKLRELCG